MSDIEVVANAFQKMHDLALAARERVLAEEKEPRCTEEILACVAIIQRKINALVPLISPQLSKIAAFHLSIEAGEWRVAFFREVRAFKLLGGAIAYFESTKRRREELFDLKDLVAHAATQQPVPTATAAGEKSGAKKLKRSTQKGEAEAKIIPVLTKHHKYAEGGSLNIEPMSVRQLETAADVSASSASRFFEKYFLPKGETGGGHAKYAAACLRDFSARVLPVLKSLNGDYQIDDTYGNAPPGQ